MSAISDPRQRSRALSHKAARRRKGRRRGKHEPDLAGLGQQSVLEPLEPRLLLSVNLLGVPNWIDQGPGPVDNTPQRQDGGAVEAIAAHPTDPDTLIVGTVNGGIWLTTNATAASPTWTPLTDQLPSLSISAIAYSPLDPTCNTLYAGFGRRSAGAWDGGPDAGLARTSDGGTTWVMIGQDDLVGLDIRSVVPTAIGTSLADQVVLVASPEGGVYRSTDGGLSFTRVSGSDGSADGLDNDADGTVDEVGELNLPDEDAMHLVGDPGNAMRFYAAIPAEGIYRSDDGGASWVQVNGSGATSLSWALPGVRIELSVHDSPGNNVVYAAILQNNVGPATTFTRRVIGFFRSTDQGANWRQVQNMPDVPASGQGAWHFAFAADPNDPDVAFMDGDVSGGYRIVMDDATPANDTWTVISAPDGSTKHVDSRDIVFDANDDLLEANDGGLYRLVSPNTPAAWSWESVNGDMRAVEFYSVALDTLNMTIFGGNQDNGTPRQPAPGAWSWPRMSGCDGGVVGADNDQVAHPGTTIIYTTSQNLTACGGLVRRTIDAANAQTGSVGVGLIVDGTGGMAMNGPGTLNGRFDNTIQFIQQYVLNAVDPSRMLIGTRYLYESTNYGDNVTALGGLIDLTNNGVDDDGDGSPDPDLDEWRPDNPIGQVTAMAYGGRLGGVDNPEVIYVASGTTLRLRTAIVNGDLTDFITLPAYPGSDIRDIILDPDDWGRGYVVDNAGRVFSFINAGASAADWTNISGNIADLAELGPDLRTIEVITTTPAPGDDVVVVGGLGGVYRTLNPGPGAVWAEVGVNMPNAVTRDLRYYASVDVLLAGTYGRGAWTISNASTALASPSVLQIDGDTDVAGQDDVIKLMRDGDNPAMLLVFLNSAVPTASYPMSAFEQINVNGLGGNDTLIVDSSNGLITVPLGIRYDAGIGFDDLRLEQTDGDTQTDETLAVGARPRSGESIIVGPSGVQTIFFEKTEPIVTMVPSLSFSITSIPGLASLLQLDNAINYTAGQTIPNSGRVTVDNFEPIEFINKQNLVIDAGAGSDTIHLNNASTPTGLIGIAVNGDDPTVGDTLIVNGVAATLAVDTGTSTITGASGAGGVDPITYGTIEQLVVNAGASSTLAVSGSADYTVNPGAADDEGTILTDSIPISFLGFGSGDTVDLDGTGDLVINGTDADDTFTVAATSGDVTPAGRATVERSGTLTNLLLNGLNGDDRFDVAGPQPYTTIALAGGDPSASDVADLTGDGAAGMTASVGGSSPSVAGGGLGTVDLSGVEVVNIDASGEDLAVSATGSDDGMWVTPLGPDSGALQVNGVSPAVNFSGTDTFSVDLLGGSDTLTVNGSAEADSIAVSGTAVAITGKEAVNYAGAEALTVNALAGDDSFDVTPAGIPIFVDGGDPIASLPGDLLTIQAGGDPVTLNPGPESDEGSFDVGANEPVSFDHIESFSVSGGGPLVINGTNGPDAITLIARDDSTHAGADGVQDFTVSVNDSPEVLFLDVAEVTVNALSGSDEIVLRTPAPNDAAWGTDVTLNAGPPSASDRVVVETPGADPETVAYTPSGPDAGSLDIDGDLVTLTGVEELVYDGEGDDDSLTVVGTAGDDVIVHSPGGLDDAGTFAVNTLLPLAYQSLGGGAALAADGSGGADELVVNGTAAGDAFVVDESGADWVVALNSRLPVVARNADTLTLEGFGGDDAFSILPAIQTSPFATLNVRGGDEASAAGDQLHLVGTAGDDSFDLSGQTVAAGGVTVNGVGVEKIGLGAGDGSDLITYNGVDGVSEDINIIGSTAAGAGHLIVPGVAAYQFTGVELFDVNANDGLAGDTDTLTFTGTNDRDTFDVDLNAAATTADPILELKNASGNTTQLTLRNYTGFAALNIMGLGGKDVFNVYTGPDVGREIFIDAGLPAGKKKETDLLKVFYQMPRPRIIHSAATQDPDSGIVDLLYDSGQRSVVQYTGVEDVVIRKY